MKSRLHSGRVSLLLVLAFTTLSLAGCPGPTRKPSPAPAPPPTLEMAEFRQLADSLSTEAVKVKGVSNATVILQGWGNRINAIVGLTLRDGLSAARQREIKNEVARRIKESNPRIKRVQVTSDPEIVQRIKEVAKAVADGKPVSEVQPDINSISRSIP